MRIIVSACLLGENCKYNGGNNRNEDVLAFCRGHEIFAVCPEVEGGLPTPRVPAEIVEGVVVNAEGVSVDAQYRLGVARILERLDGEGGPGLDTVDLAILQSRSPSCGVRQIYDGSFTGTLVSGQGVFAAALAARGVPLKDSGEFAER